MTRTTLISFLLTLGVGTSAWAAPPPPAALTDKEEAEEREAPAVETGEPSPPSRAAAFAGAYMASTGLGIAWVVNVVAVWALLVAGVLFPPALPLGFLGACTSGLLACGLPIGQGVVGSMLGEAMGGYDSWLAHVLTVAAAFVSTFVAGGLLLVASVLAVGILANYVVGPYQTGSVLPDGTFRASLVPASFAAQAGATVVLALFVTLLQPLVPATAFALTTSSSRDTAEQRRDRRRERRERREERRERRRPRPDRDDGGAGPYDVNMRF